METKLLSQMKKVLLKFPEYWEAETLNKTKVIDDLRNYRRDLIGSLLEDETIRNTYALEINDTQIFKIDEFISMLRFKNYWENSYTRYSNEIGLTSDGNYLKYNSDVVLDFPHKDCVLEGGMTKEDVGKNEVFYHNVLAKEEIDVMLSPKVLTNIKRYNKNGDSEVTNFSDSDNLVIKGNNLIALHTLKKRFAGKVKLIYIDPPYNTGEDSFKYNDRFNHSTWLTFMKNRLSIAIELLCEGGSLWINIGDEEVHYLKVLLDEILPNGFIANVLWQKRTSPDSRATIGDAHDHILVFTNNKELFKKGINKLPLSESRKKEFKNPDNDPNGSWVSVDMTGQTGHATSSQFYDITLPSGRKIAPPEGRCWAISQNKLEILRKENRIWFGSNGDGRPRFKRYLNESEGATPWTWWENKEVGHNQEAKKESIVLFGNDNPFSTPKPERLLHRIITLCTSENELVLDFFAGSGTTAAVCHKMNRQYIAIEQMTYEIDYVPTRLQKVIKNEQGGISKEVGWQGGGSFVYAELHKLNEGYVQKVNQVDSDTDLAYVIDIILNNAFINFQVNLARISYNDEDFNSLSLEEKKEILIKTLDANQQYLSYSEIDDIQFNIPESVKQFNHSFYNSGEKS